MARQTTNSRRFRERLRLLRYLPQHLHQHPHHRPRPCLSRHRQTTKKMKTTLPPHRHLTHYPEPAPFPHKESRLQRVGAMAGKTS
jgi:hypothetical protein